MLKKLLSLFTVMAVISSALVFSVRAESRARAVISPVAYVKAGENCRIDITAYDFDKIAPSGGAYGFKIILPSVLQVTSVYRDGEKLALTTNERSGGYLLKSNNELWLIELFNYSDEYNPTEMMKYTVIATVNGDAAAGRYPIDFSDKTSVADNNEEWIDIDLKNSYLTVAARKDCFKGDVNSDGFVKTDDLVMLKKKLLNSLSVAFSADCADANADGVINIIDMVTVKKCITETFDRVYLSVTGNDGAAGTADAPYATLNRALEAVSCGGTVEVVGNYTVSPDFYWNRYSKQVNITGGTLDFSALSDVKAGNAVSFDNMTLKFKENGNIYACGYPFYIGDGVTVNGVTTIYGGDTASVDSTDITLLSGNYKAIYGGGNGAAVEGDTKLILGGTVNNFAADAFGNYKIYGGGNSGKVGGSTYVTVNNGVNANLDYTSHSALMCLYGGSYGAEVSGNTSVTVNEGARFNYIYGGSNGSGADVKGIATVNYKGNAMSIYGGNSGASFSGDTAVNINGGWVEQVFGGCEGASMTGDANVKLTGGTVVRRIYGGCYNNAERSGISLNWSSSHHVTGTTNVTIGSGVNITLSYNDDERGIFACSRYKALFDDEYATFIFDSEEAYNKYYSKLGPDGFLANLFFIKKPYHQIITP